jgi:glycosyltransferase involved in cell wall biosynthesis
MDSTRLRGPTDARSPWLSLLVPVYDVEPYLLPFARSLLAQELDGVELIFVDDGSTDRSAELLETLASAHPGLIHVLRHSTNGGPGAARNALLDEARGEWLWFLDPDDLVEPGAVASLRRILDRHRPDLVMCDFRVFDNRGGAVDPGDDHVASFHGPRREFSVDREALLGGLFRAGKLHLWTNVVRREAWPDSIRFRPRRAFQDLAVMARIAMRVQSWFHTDEVWMSYRQRPGSIQTKLTLDRLEDWMVALEGYAAELRGWEVDVGPGTHAAIADYCARSLIRVTELTDVLAGAGCEPYHRRNVARWHSACPWSPERLERAYWLRGRMGRALRWRRCRRRVGL